MNMLALILDIKLPHERHTLTMDPGTVLVIDTETSGLPSRRSDYKDLPAWDSCRLVEIAWNLYTRGGVLLSSYTNVVKPDGFIISPGSEAIHGISTSHALSAGVPINQVWIDLEDVLRTREVAIVVAHNAEFDNCVVKSELLRHGRTDILKLWRKVPKYCTMLATTKPNEKYKKLTEAYFDTFGEMPSGTLHRAHADVEVCAQVYFQIDK